MTPFASRSSFLIERKHSIALLRLFHIPIQQLAKRLAAVAMLALLFQGQFGKSLAQSREVKQRIVPEALRASRDGEQFTVDLARERGQCLAVTRQRDHAHIFSRMFTAQANVLVG